MVKEQIALYKKWREVLQFGSFYRGRNFSGGTGSVLCKENGNEMEWTCVSKDRKQAVGFLMQKLCIPNASAGFYFAKGLRKEWKYHFYNRTLKYDVKDFGDLVNTVSPVHIKQDSAMHHLVAKFVKMDGETENYEVYGDTLMYAGVRLKQDFSGTGYDSQVRYYPDFGARMYFMECAE